MDEQTKKKELRLKILRRAKGHEFGNFVQGLVDFGIIVALIPLVVSNLLVAIIILFLLGIIAWILDFLGSKAPVGIKTFFQNIRKKLRRSKRKKSDTFYLIRSVCTGKEDGDDEDALYVYFDQYKILDTNVRGSSYNVIYRGPFVGEEFFLQFYEGDTEPCRVYPCAEWYLGEELQGFLRE